VSAKYVAAVRGAFGSGLAAAAFDAAPAPGVMSDAAIQAEIAKIVALDHWRPDPKTPIFVLTASGAIVAADGFCSYRSALAPGRDRSHPIAYTVIPYLATVGACAAPGGYTPSGDPAVDTLVINLNRASREFAMTP
jgi:hypothetical protein